MRSSLSVRPIRLLLAAGLLVAFLFNYWMGDDGFITFRTLDNFVNGYGLRWNTDERVQAFTNPLWLFYLTPFYWLTGAIYPTVLIATAIIFVLLTILLLKRLKSDAVALAAVCLLILSKSFMEYTSSGLENVLSYLLAFLYFDGFMKALGPRTSYRPGSSPSIFPTAQPPVAENATGTYRLSFLLALLMLNRLDLGLLFLVPHSFLLYKILRAPGALRSVTLHGLTFLPLLAWLVFSLVYYGFPFPNTFYAKTNFPIADVRVKWVLGYYTYCILMDPIILIVPLVALIASCLPGRRFYLLFGAGTVLYNLYLIQIGGDFMGGRWLTVPYLLSVLVLAEIVSVPFSHISTIKGLAGSAALLAAVNLASYLMMGINPFLHEQSVNLKHFEGVLDERLTWGPFTRIPSCMKGHCYDWLPLYQVGLNRKKNGPPIVRWAVIGIFGYAAGPNVKIVDELGLSDPLLARMEGRPDGPGHCPRPMPRGYDEPGQHILDPQIAAYNEGIRLITQGDLFSRERFAAIYDYNLGKRSRYAGPIVTP